MKKHIIILAAIGLAAFQLGGCAQLAAGAANVAASVAGSSAHQAKTLAEAEQAATLVTQGADVAVNSGKLDRGTLTEISALSDGLHSALASLEQANTNGQALNFAAFNAALQAYNAYMTTKGIAH